VFNTPTLSVHPCATHPQATIERVHNRSNVADMECQPFYRHLRDHFAWHVVREL